MERPEGSNEMPPGMAGSSQPTPTPSSSQPKPESKPAPGTTPPPKAPEPEQEDESMEDDDEAVAKKTAEEEKQKGNAAYKARKFEEAIEHYTKAWDTWPKDVTYLTNLSGKFEHYL